ncbi:inorganic triphosphatase YgiF [Mesocricetibacter intestinalis]|uniref:Inorganic triphosphatase YgiF n=1 Tax=Mesocricetibacter intestinalis TaxID=1521930 RepID=A0A4R6VGP1_9PAST|nr:CYTH domain-containing protein [Mesocricetibacter intestinalis]TDQ57035.1 inorganic triphosphatase YgiF [Mesocricetibacter intestinalis]
MSDEVELKLALDSGVCPALLREIRRFKVLSEKSDYLTNCYYDTEYHYFSAAQMGLRVRCEGGRFTLTLKSGGKVTGGLHIRPEYNVSLDSEAPDLARLVPLLPEGLVPDSVLQQPLQAIFSTDFERRSWLLQSASGAQIEVALDQGVIQAGNAQEGICELELELKTGELADLLDFVAELKLSGAVRFSSRSKAERGYQLAGLKVPPPQDWAKGWLDTFNQAERAEKTQQKITALLGYEQALIEDTLQSAPTPDFTQTVERVGAFFNLYHYYCTQGECLGENEALRQSNEELLEEIKAIIRTHSANWDNQEALQALSAILQQPDYVHRMCALIRLSQNK